VMRRAGVEEGGRVVTSALRSRSFAGLGAVEPSCFAAPKVVETHILFRHPHPCSVQETLYTATSIDR